LASGRECCAAGPPGTRQITVRAAAGWDQVASDPATSAGPAPAAPALGTGRVAPSPATEAHGSAGPGDASVRIRLDLSYDGSGFAGWACQPSQRTVQAVLEEALGRLLRLPTLPALTVAGRTDAGVHARGQVAHADVPAAGWAQAGPAAARRLSRLLPADIRVHGIGPAPEGFDARFSALWRRYSYRVCDDPAVAEPLRRHDTLWYRHRVDVRAMNDASAACTGEHDFAAFCRRREGATTVRNLLNLEWARTSPSVATATVIADAFCHNMVRALVGAMLKVGDGSKPVGWPAQVLAGRVRDPAVTVVAPHGLCLEEVRYPAPAQLSARAQATRRLRTRA
jgi:tRNA pseudouridine38-40 synthase